MLSGAAGAARRGRAALAPSLTRSLAGTHAGADSCAGADKGSHKETIEERDKRQQRQQRQRQHQGCGAAGSGSDSPTSGPHPVPVLLPLALSLEEQPLPPAPLGRAPGLLAREGRGREALASPSSQRQMPIEIVCKIKFAEEDAKPKEKEAGDEQSLLGASQGAAAPRDLATFASTSTLHGLGRACGPGPHGLRRTLWALALLTSMAAFLYQAAGLAQGYLTRPHLVAMDPAAPAPVAGFPAVTLCNINRFRHSALSDADIFHLANLTGLPPKDRDGHRAAGLRYPEPDMVDILNRTGHQLADMLKSCNFSGHHCSASNFSVVYTRYGKCYTFNADPRSSLPSRAGGMGSGLEIMLDIQQEEYLPIWRETNETSFEAGIRVQIHSQEEPPYIHQLGFGVSPGFQTFVSCQEQRLTYLPQPWGNCRAESELRKPELQGYSAYSVSACRLRCEKEAVLQRCHCRMVHMPGGHPTPSQPSMPPCWAPEPPGARGKALIICTGRCMGTTCVCVCTCVSVHVCVWDFYTWFHICIWECQQADASVHVNMYLCMCMLIYICACVFAGVVCVGFKHMYANVSMCVHARMCLYLGVLGRGEVITDSRNNLLSFQAMRPSAHQISTSSVPTTHWTPWVGAPRARASAPPPAT
uniref:Acid sensing ion channel subunit family member 4 n=1 Tax=Callithrix jacchus TaxID=9483 RepID=A0A8I3X0B5_CALJA